MSFPEHALSRVEYDPCGECRKGTCDNCDACQWSASLPGAARYTEDDPTVTHEPTEEPA